MTDTFEKHFEKNHIGCWLWKGASSKASNGRYGIYRTGRASRISYERYVGKIPNGLELDHLCRNTLCIRPDHLEAVTHKENMHRGISPSAFHAKKTRCPNGHAYDILRNCGSRRCSVCHKNYCVKYRRKRKEALSLAKKEVKE